MKTFQLLFKENLDMLTTRRRFLTDEVLLCTVGHHSVQISTASSVTGVVPCWKSHFPTVIAHPGFSYSRFRHLQQENSVRNCRACRERFIHSLCLEFLNLIIAFEFLLIVELAVRYPCKLTGNHGYSHQLMYVCFIMLPCCFCLIPLPLLLLEFVGC